MFGPRRRNNSWEDTSYIPLSTEADELDNDAEDIVKDLREIILSKHLVEEVSKEDVDKIPSPMPRENILDEQRYDYFCQSSTAKETTATASFFFEEEDGYLFRQDPKDETLV